MQITTETKDLSGPRLNAWLQEGSVVQMVEQISSQVRTHPSDSGKRWLLSQLFCLQGAWDRALKQLQTSVQIQQEREQNAQVIRGLIRGEKMRAEVMSGKATPGFVIDQPPAWMAGLLDALRLGAEQKLEQADAVRETVLAEVPDVAGTLNEDTEFAWLSDTDTRLGPVCELIVAGMYRWCPFCELSSLTLHPPEGILDLLWARTEAVLSDGTIVKGYIPVRYPGSEHASDKECLARITTWREEGRTGIIGLGQKTWMTNVADYGLLDLRHIAFATKV
jgi:type VI secretion system protein ImpE